MMNVNVLDFNGSKDSTLLLFMALVFVTFRENVSRSQPLYIYHLITINPEEINLFSTDWITNFVL